MTFEVVSKLENERRYFEVSTRVLVWLLVSLSFSNDDKL